MFGPKNASQNIVAARVREVQVPQAADARYASDTNPFQMQRIVIDLTTARLEGDPYKLNFPVLSMHVESATDSGSNIRVSLNSDSSLQIQNYKKMILNDAMELDHATNGLFLTWPAQSGKSLTLIVFVGVRFRSGSQLSITAGGVSITEGDTFTDSNVVVAATATQLAASSSTRKVLFVQNQSGQPMYIGDSTVTTTKGALLAVGGSLEWKSAAACYAIAASAGDSLYVAVFS